MSLLKIVALSDTHNQHDKVTVPDGDILIHCGDATGVGSFNEVIRFNKWISSLPHKHKLFIPGNHDFLFQTDFNIAKELLESVTVLCDSEVIISGIKFYGSPYTPFYNNWAFGLHTKEELKRKWQAIPYDVDILITHGPGFGLRDYLPGAGHIGCTELRSALERIKPKYHLCGHIHAGHGKEIFEDTTILNCAICDEDYKVVNPVTVFEVNSNE